MLANAIALKSPYDPAGGAAAPLLEDTFTEEADTDITTHTPDLNNTGNGWTNPAGKNPVEVLASTDQARSKNVSGFTTGWAAIDIGTATAVLTLDIDPYSAFFLCYGALNADANLDNGWLFSWNASGGVAIVQRTNNSNVNRASAAVAATDQLRRALFTRSAGSLALDFNSGEATLTYNSATSYGTYAGMALYRVDSGWHGADYLKVEAI